MPRGAERLAGVSQARPLASGTRCPYRSTVVVIELWPSQRETSAASCAGATTQPTPVRVPSTRVVAVTGSPCPAAAAVADRRPGRILLMSPTAAVGQKQAHHLQPHSGPSRDRPDRKRETGQMDLVTRQCHHNI